MTNASDGSLRERRGLTQTFGLIETEKSDLESWRWWTLPELRNTEDQLTPRQLARYLGDLLRDGPPRTPMTVGV